MSINGISGPGPLSPLPPAGQQAQTRSGEAGGGFGEMIRSAVQGVNGQQAESAAAIQDLLTGRSQDIVPVVAAVAKADMSFKLLLGVRNKVIEAYKQTMNMQI